MALERLRIFAYDGQVGPSVLPEQLVNFSRPAPVTLFMNRAVWGANETVLRRKFPDLRVRNVTADGKRASWSTCLRGPKPCY